MKALFGVVLGIGLASFAALAWVARKLLSLGRPLGAGDVVVMAVLLLFAAFCVGIGWYLIKVTSPDPAPAAQQAVSATPSRRVTLSRGCAAVGVILVILSVLLPPDWYPVALLFAGLALLAVSHALTPCVERLELLRRARDSTRQL